MSGLCLFPCSPTFLCKLPYFTIIEMRQKQAIRTVRAASILRCGAPPLGVNTGKVKVVQINAYNNKKTILGGDNRCSTSYLTG